MSDLSTAKVLVTPRSFGQSDPELHEFLEARVGEVVYNPHGRALNSEEVRTLLSDCDGYIAGVDMIEAKALEKSPKLKVIARYGVGVDNVDLEAAKLYGMTVTNTPLANAQSVAELALGLTLSLMRQIPFATNQTRNGDWPRIKGFTLKGKTVGLVGFGMIGKKFAELLGGFGCRVMAYDLYPDMDAAKEIGVELTSMDTLVADADVVSLHLPANEKTKKLIDRKFLRAMKVGSFLINTSRGEVIDEHALFEALSSGHLAGAGLDVLSEEPPKSDHPLLKMNNVLVTPHSGAHSDGATNAMGWTALEDCLAVLSGKEPKFKVV